MKNEIEEYPSEVRESVSQLYNAENYANRIFMLKSSKQPFNGVIGLAPAILCAHV